MMKNMKVLIRLTSLGMAIVLLILVGFSIWAAMITLDAATRAQEAVHLSEQYQQARFAVGAEESLERKYRIEPGPEVLAGHRAAGVLLVSSLNIVYRDGDASDRALVEQMLALHKRYLITTGLMFAAVDKGKTAQVIALDHGTVDPVFGVIQQRVNMAANEHYVKANQSLDVLSNTEHRVVIATPSVFALGLFLISVLWMVLRAYQRRMDEVTQSELARFEQAALTDNLTNLGNHRAYQQALQRTMKRVLYSGEHVVLALINIDELKVVNDEYGHLYGDRVLVELAKVLGTLEAGTTFRRSGDEFAVILPALSLSEARLSLEHLRKEAENPLLRSTISIGIAITTPEEQGMDLLQEQADAALREAKRRGRNVVITFDEIRESTSMLAPVKVQALRRLLEEQKVKVAFQPIWSMQEGTVMAFEALTRPDPAYGFNGPQEAFDIAEKLGHAHELDYICVQAILRRARELPAGVLLFLNLTPQSLAHDLLTGAVLLEAVIEAGLTVDRVVLELTERSTLPMPMVVRQARKLQKLGFRLALDDVGAGNAGLEMMSQLSVDFIKIDRAVVVNALTDKAAQGVLAGIAAIAHEMGAFVIAEGIENVEMLALIQRDGLQAVQGYLLGRPCEKIPDLDALQVLSPMVLGSA